MRPKDVESRHFQVVFSFLAFRSRRLPRSRLFSVSPIVISQVRGTGVSDFRRFDPLDDPETIYRRVRRRNPTDARPIEYLGRIRDSIRQSQREETRRSGVRRDERESRVCVRFTNSCYRIYKKALGCRAVEQRDRVSARES